jgi:DNA mismatch repair ATPase MutS
MSFGINVARMAGIPKSVLDIAKKKADEFSHVAKMKALKVN